MDHICKVKMYSDLPSKLKKKYLLLALKIKFNI